jgi:hypothetical protein
MPSWPFLEPGKLADQPWFPKANSVEERSAAEEEYYEGCARAMSAQVEAAHAAGWTNVSVNWCPYNPDSEHLGKDIAAPGSDWAWERIGARLVEQADACAVDLPRGIPPSNAIAACAVRLDQNNKYFNTLPRARRARPVFSARLPSGGQDAAPAVSPEDFRAMIASAFFSGVEGVELICGTPAGQDNKVSTPNDPLPAAFEALALVKPIEHLLSHGEPKADVDAQHILSDKLPIIRRVKLGSLHALMTYDPCGGNGKPPRTVTLTDFDAHKGLTVSIPADEHTRIFLLSETK